MVIIALLILAVILSAANLAFAYRMYRKPPEREHYTPDLSPEVRILIGAEYIRRAQHQPIRDLVEEKRRIVHERLSEEIARRSQV